MAIAGAIASLAGTAVSAIGAMSQAAAQRRAAEYQAAVARNLAKFEMQKGVVEEQNKRMETGAILGQQRAAQGASGVEANIGSSLAVRTSTQVLGELDALTIRNNAIARANAMKDQAQLYDMEADSAMTEGWINATSSILSGASSFASKWNDYKSKSLLV